LQLFVYNNLKVYSGFYAFLIEAKLQNYLTICIKITFKLLQTVLYSFIRENF